MLLSLLAPPRSDLPRMFGLAPVDGTVKTKSSWTLERKNPLQTLKPRWPISDELTKQHGRPLIRPASSTLNG